MFVQKAFVLWLTGLPCSGKTTLSNALKSEFIRYGLVPEQLDGDAVRQKKTLPLGYTKEDRMKNVMDVILEASSLEKHGRIVLVSLISPYRIMREFARTLTSDFTEIYVRCPLSVCERRDVKGMYRLAREGKIKNFTGVSDPYEEPVSPELIIETDTLNIKAAVEKIISYLKDRELIPLRPPQKMAHLQKCA